MPDGTEKTGVDAVNRALSILSAFAENRREMTLAELSRATGLYKSTILRISQSLEEKRYLTRADGRFRPGPELWRLGSLYRRSLDLAAVIRPVLQRLVNETSETASFYVRDGDARICLFRLNSPRPVRHHLDEGVRLPLERGAAGRALNQFDENGRLRTPPLEPIMVSRGERDPEVGAVAALAFDRHQTLMGALSVSTLLARFDPSAETRFRECLARETEGLTRLEFRA
jgi:DNA-binding IclR family transcriptional regulator